MLVISRREKVGLELLSKDKDRLSILKRDSFFQLTRRQKRKHRNKRQKTYIYKLISFLNKLIGNNA